MEKAKSKGWFKRNFWPCTKGVRLTSILCALSMVLEVVLEVLIPLMMARALNNIRSGEPSISYLIRLGLIMVGLSFASLACGMLGARLSAVSSMGFSKQLSRRLFHKIQDFSFSNIDKFSTASLVTRITTDVSNVQRTYMQLIRLAFRSPVMFVFATIMAFRLHAELALIFAVAIPMLIAFVAILSVKAFPRFQRMIKSFDGLNATVQENLIGIRVVKTFVREEHEKEKFYKRAQEVTNAQISAEKLVIFIMPFTQIVMQFSKLAITGIGGNFMIAGELGIGDITAMISYAVMILNSLTMLSMLSVTVFISRASITRINEVLDTEPDIQPNNQSELVVSDGSIEFDNVNFTYVKGETDYVLKDINFNIKAGETVGIIAGTGEGKSTLVQLIPRLYDVDTGVVRVGGKNVKDYSLHALRDAVAVVLQKNVLFSGTIKENLLWGDPNATDEEIIEACKLAQAHNFIESFPKGYETELGQGGVNVSGGQKQRLCIARALIKKPKILILDDSTSAVDTATDSKIREAFRNSLPNTTKIIIAQRVASVMEADKIVVMDKGRIADIGRHDELLRRCEIYKEVYESQAMGVK